MALTVEIVMPGEKLDFLRVKSVVFQSAEGQVGVLPGHIPMLCLLDAGVLNVATVDGNRRFVTGDGLARVSNDRVTFLVNNLIPEAEIRVEEALRNHEKLQKAVTSLASASREERLKELHFVKAQLDLLGLKPPP